MFKMNLEQGDKDLHLDRHDDHHRRCDHLQIIHQLVVVNQILEWRNDQV